MVLNMTDIHLGIEGRLQALLIKRTLISVMPKPTNPMFNIVTGTIMFIINLINLLS